MAIPYLGKPLDYYEDLDRDLLSITSQFLDGVAFLHSKCVAHLDLKPSHILFDENGSIYIIDYDLSMKFKDTSELTTGFQGTKGFTAPEVGEEPYNPFLADVWSAGRVIVDLLFLRHDHEHAEFLKSLYRRMMDEDPKKRPNAQDVAREIGEYIERSVQAQCSNRTTTFS